MDYHVEIPAGTALSAFDCILTWNQLKESSGVARARLSPAIPQFFDRGNIAGTRFLLGNVAAEVTAETLHSLLRLVLEHRGIRQSTTLRILSQPDGATLLELSFPGTP